MAYFLPWIVAPGISLTLGAYDLAEWTSLHPAVRYVDPSLVVTFALRMQPILIVAILAFNSANNNRIARLIVTAIAIITSLALLPPLEFFNNTGDINYRQQFYLAISTLIIAGIGLSGIFKSFSRIIAMLLAAIGLGTTIYALATSYQLMLNFSLPVNVGLGGIMLVVFYSAIFLANIKRDA